MTPLAITWDMDPIFIGLGSLSIAYYGVMWVLAFFAGERVFDRMVRSEGLSGELTYSALFYMLVSAIIGARLGHCLFYDFGDFFLDPFMGEFPYVKVLNIRGGGLASHGAAIGMAVGIVLWSRKWRIPSIWMFDRVGIPVAIGGAFIRMGNFFNSEIYGGPTELPWGVIFVRDGNTVPHHPTQIYEALAYLLIFFALLHIYYRTRLRERRGFMFGAFLLLLFGARLLIESIKLVQVEWELGMVDAIGLNMGQVLSLPFVVLGGWFLWRAMRGEPQPYTDMPKAPKAPGKSNKIKKK